MDSNDRSRQLAQLVQEIREQLGDHNVLDALARELAHDRLLIAELTQRLSQSEKELGALKLAQQARDILMPQAAPIYKGRTEATVESSAPLPADSGFHVLERDGNGTIFRWSGPTNHFHYDLHLDRSVHLLFSLQVPLWGAEHAKGLISTCEGLQIRLRRRQAGRTLVFDGVLTPRSEVGMTRIGFAVEQVQTVAAKTEGAPARQLGMPVLRLKVSPIDDVARAEWAQETGATGPEPALEVVANKPALKAAADARALG